MKLKHFLKILFSRIYVRIRSGPLKGKRWVATSGGKFISGNQEPYKVSAFIKNFKKGEVLFDIGAHIGYFTAIAADINRNEGRIFAFEPNPMNAKLFRIHMKINNFQNVTFFEKAVGETDGEVMFDSGHGSATGFVSRTGKLKIGQVSVDRMVRDAILPPPDFIKIDVEGGEIEVLKGLKNVVSKYKPKIIVATHNQECHNYVIDFLQSNSYKYEILNPEAKKGDTEIIALPV